MDELQIFENPAFGKIRTVRQEDEILFIAADVCAALEIKNSRDALKRLDDDEKGVVLIYTPGGKQKLNAVNEYGLYNLVIASRKKEANKFKRWITHEVIPAIRKHGGYLTNEKIEEVLTDPDTIIKLATSLKQERAKREEAEKQLKEAEPKVIFADAVSASKNTVLVGELAKIIKQNGQEIGQKRMFEWLRNNGYLIKQKCADYNLPTQKAMELGLFEIKKTAITHSDGHVTVSRTVKVTGKGQQYFINKFATLAEGGAA